MRSRLLSLHRSGHLECESESRDNASITEGYPERTDRSVGVSPIAEVFSSFLSSYHYLLSGRRGTAILLDAGPGQAPDGRLVGNRPV